MYSVHSPFSQRSFNRISLCCTVSTMDDKSKIRRLADLIDGQLIPFKPDTNKLQVFENREIFYTSPTESNSTVPEGTFCFWDLSAEPNRTNPQKDFTTAVRHVGLTPIRIKYISQIKTIRDLLTSREFSRDFNPDAYSLPVLYVWSENNHYVGVQIRPDRVEQNNGDFSLSGVSSLPKYIINLNHAIRFKILFNNRTECIDFCPKTSLTQPFATITSDRLLVTPPVETLSHLLQNQFGSWKNFQEATDGEKRDQKLFNLLLELTAYPDIKKQMQAELAISDEEFEDAKAQLLERADKFLKSQDVTSNIILNAACRLPGMSEDLEKSAKEKWISEHQHEIHEKNRELDDTKEEIRKSKAILSQLNDQVRSLQGQISNLSEQKKEISLFQTKVSEKIEDNLQKAHEIFLCKIADLPFSLHFDQNAPNPTQSEPSVNASGQSNVGNMSAVAATAVNNAEANSQQWIKSARRALKGLGMRLNVISGFIKLTTTMALHRSPMLFAGPRCGVFAQTMALLWTGRPALEADLDAAPLDDIFKQLEALRRDEPNAALAPVVIFRGVIQGARLSNLLSDARLDRCTPIFVVGFSEELALYPLSLLNSVMPFFFEVLTTPMLRADINDALSHPNDSLLKEWTNAEVEQLSTVVPESIKLPIQCLDRTEALLGSAQGIFHGKTEEETQALTLLSLLPASVLLAQHPEAALEKVESLLKDSAGGWLKGEESEKLSEFLCQFKDAD